MYRRRLSERAVLTPPATKLVPRSPPTTNTTTTNHLNPTRRSNACTLRRCQTQNTKSNGKDGDFECPAKQHAPSP